MLEAICALAAFVKEFEFQLVPGQDISMTTGATIHTKNVSGSDKKILGWISG